MLLRDSPNFSVASFLPFRMTFSQWDPLPKFTVYSSFSAVCLHCIYILSQTSWWNRAWRPIFALCYCENYWHDDTTIHMKHRGWAYDLITTQYKCGWTRSVPRPAQHTLVTRRPICEWMCRRHLSHACSLKSYRLTETEQLRRVQLAALINAYT